jgi:hypothetical protein
MNGRTLDPIWSLLYVAVIAFCLWRGAYGAAIGAFAMAAGSFGTPGFVKKMGSSAVLLGLAFSGLCALAAAIGLTSSFEGLNNSATTYALGALLFASLAIFAHMAVRTEQILRAQRMNTEGQVK